MARGAEIYLFFLFFSIDANVLYCNTISKAIGGNKERFWRGNKLPGDKHYVANAPLQVVLGGVHGTGGGHFLHELRK